MKIKLLHNQGYTVWATVTKLKNSPFVHLQFDTETPNRQGDLIYKERAFEAYLYPSELDRLVQLLSGAESTTTPTHRNQENDEQIIPI